MSEFDYTAHVSTMRRATMIDDDDDNDDDDFDTDSDVEEEGV